MKIIVYGSLRKGEYNYQYFKRWFGDDINHVKTTTIDGFTLHSLGSYPCAVRGEGKLVVDILEVSEEVSKDIYDMEIGAGYYVDMVHVEDEKLPIYLMANSNQKVVEHGDWTKRTN